MAKNDKNNRVGKEFPSAQVNWGIGINVKPLLKSYK